jgi:hypothetical protein
LASGSTLMRTAVLPFEHTTLSRAGVSQLLHPGLLDP